MISLIPPVLILVGAIAWAGLTFQKQSALNAEMARLQQTAADLQKVRARNADLRELQTLPQEIERLKRENAQLPEAASEVQRLTARKGELEKELATRKDSLQQEHLARLMNENRALSNQAQELSLPDQTAPVTLPVTVPGAPGDPAVPPAGGL